MKDGLLDWRWDGFLTLMTFLDLDFICAVAGRTRSFFLVPHKLAPAMYDVVPPCRSTFAVIGRPPRLLPLPPLPPPLPLLMLPPTLPLFVPLAVAGRGGLSDIAVVIFAPPVREAVAGLAAAEAIAASPRCILMRPLPEEAPSNL